MKSEVIKQIIALVRKAQELAASIGIPNVLQPGIVKEMIIADLLGHQLISTKHGADACDPNDPSVKFEYLSCEEGGTGQLDRMKKEPLEDRLKSLERINRNSKIYLAIFYKAKQIRVKRIYEIEPGVLRIGVEEKLNQSSNAISHVGFSEKWARQNGKLVYQDQADS